MSQPIQDALAVSTSARTETSQRPIMYMETVDAYNKWAEVYDTDGNFLQALDTIKIHHLLPHFLDLVASSHPHPLKLVDLGCGTGRNTLQLFKAAHPETKIVGLDASPGMLAVARTALEKQTAETSSSPDFTPRAVQLATFDLLQTPVTPPECSLGAAGVISTLVLEHIPVQRFFEGAAALLRPGGYLLVTNMHADMGAISQAGFVDVGTGVKVRPTSYAYTVAEVVGAAERVGFVVEDLDEEGVRESMVEEGMGEGLGVRSRKWVGVMVWFGICFRKRG